MPSRVNLMSSSQVKCLATDCRLALALASLVLALALHQAAEVAGRYLEPESFGVASYRDFSGAANNVRPNMLRRRQDFTDGSDDDEADEPDDHNAAASYRNQDDQNSGGQATDGAGGQNDGFEDNEADGPYEETPVEKEGQADLERFFDDHLGASDREGMDKENLPTNLIASLSEPPRLDAFEASVLRAAPLAAVRNPTVRAAELSPIALPTIQTTSFIRLPAERKLIVTNQITRNTIGAPIVYGDRGGDSGARELGANGAERQTAARDDGHEAAFGRARLSPSSSSSASTSSMAAVAAAALNDPANISLNIEMEPLDGDSGERQPGRPDARVDKMRATGSAVVLTEDEDEDRVYVTNATNKPFRIDALGGYDPEADFQDAAKELDGYGEAPPARGARDEPEVKRRAAGGGGNERRPRHELSFHDSPDEDMYEDASETDEVTFGQDDPYQTDLEAEMRQQHYDKVGQFGADEPAQSGSGSNGGGGGGGAPQRRVVEAPVESMPDSESSRDARDGNDFNNDDGKVDPNDDDADVDSDYKSAKPEAREDRLVASGRGHGGDDLEEGHWVNDGVDEMDIPSQSHQNFILDKAAKHDAKVRKAAEEELEASAKQQEQQPDGAGETAGHEENQRMPNADYLKNDLVEDDSGYAA